jgi:hypothetical protein
MTMNVDSEDTISEYARETTNETKIKAISSKWNNQSTVKQLAPI